MMRLLLPIMLLMIIKFISSTSYLPHEDIYRDESLELQKRAPMRFGKRAEPVYPDILYEDQNDIYEYKRAPMRFGKRAPMRFGKRSFDDSFVDQTRY